MKNIPMLDLLAEYEYMKADIDAALRKCLGHQKWVLGPEVKELENNVAAYLGADHCIGVSSGTDALVLSLRALAIKRKGDEYFTRYDEILTTPFTFTATGDAILRAGATPVFVDVDPASYNLDPEQVRDYLDRNGSKVVGIIPVHLYGQSCDMDSLMGLAQQHDLFVVEDVAQAFGGMWRSKKLGSIGTLGAFSFFPSKNLGGFGDGGMISTNDADLAGLVRMLLKHGGKDKYNVDHIGYNARLDTIQAAVLLAKLKYIDEFNDRRRKIAGRYTEMLSGIDGLMLPLAPGPVPMNDLYHVYHQYTLRTRRRDALQAHLTERGVSSMVYYPFPLHTMKVFGGAMSACAGSLAQAEAACSEVLSLPIEPLQDERTSDAITGAVKAFFGK